MNAPPSQPKGARTDVKAPKQADAGQKKAHRERAARARSAKKVKGQATIRPDSVQPPQVAREQPRRDEDETSQRSHKHSHRHGHRHRHHRCSDHGHKKRTCIEGDLRVRGDVVARNVVALNSVRAGPGGVSTVGPVSAGSLRLRNGDGSATVVTGPSAGGDTRFQFPPRGTNGSSLVLTNSATGETRWQPAPAPNAGQFEPAYVFWVAQGAADPTQQPQAWPEGVDPSRFFTSVQAAINAAAAFVPNPPAPGFYGFPQAVVVVAPGNYSGEGEIVLASGVNLITWGEVHATYLLQSLRWTPGVGINAPLANAGENVTVSGFTLLGDLVIDATQKANIGQLVLFEFRDGFSVGGADVTSRADNFGTEVIFDNVDWDQNVVIQNIAVPVIRGGVVGGILDISSLDNAYINGLEVGGGFVQRGPGRVDAVASQFFNDFILTGGNAVLTGSRVRGFIRAVNPTSVVDAITSSWGGLEGPGAIRRAIDTKANGTGEVVVAGPGQQQPITFSVPFPIFPDYGVVLTPSNQAAAVASVWVSDKTASGFTLNTGDAASGAAFDLVVLGGSITILLEEAETDEAPKPERRGRSRFIVPVPTSPSETADASARAPAPPSSPVPFPRL